jgi:hypothetical protein
LLDAVNVPFVGVAVREPYDAGLPSRAESWVLSYGDDALAIEALGWVLTGRAKARGQLPVDLP